MKNYRTNGRVWSNHVDLAMSSEGARYYCRCDPWTKGKERWQGVVSWTKGLTEYLLHDRPIFCARCSIVTLFSTYIEKHSSFMHFPSIYTDQLIGGLFSGRTAFRRTLIMMYVCNHTLQAGRCSIAGVPRSDCVGNSGVRKPTDERIGRYSYNI